MTRSRFEKLPEQAPPTENEPALDAFAIISGVAVVSFKRPLRGERCHYCPEEASTRDHIVPRIAGGRATWWNLVPSCYDCNQLKGTALTGWCMCSFCERATWLWALGFVTERSLSIGKRQDRRDRRLTAEMRGERPRLHQSSAPG